MENFSFFNQICDPGLGDIQSGYNQLAGAIWVHLVRKSDPGIGTPRLEPLDQAMVWGFATHWVAVLTGGLPLSYPSIPAYIVYITMSGRMSYPASTGRKQAWSESTETPVG